MAGFKIADAYVDVDVDFAKLDAGFKAAEAKAKSFAKRSESVAEVDLTADGSKLDGDLNQATSSVKSYAGKAGSVSEVDLTADAGALSGDLNQATGAVKSYASKAESHGKVELEVDTDKLESGLDSAESKLKGFATAAGVAGGAISAALVGGIVNNMSIEAGTDKLAAQLGLTAPQSKRAGAVAGALYRDAYGENLEGVNDAVAAVMSSVRGMRNASSSDLSAITAKVLDMSAAFGVDVTRATQIAGQAVTSGLAPNVNRAMDLLTASMQRVPAAVREDLFDAADEYGPFMAQIGIKGERAFGMLVKGAEKGMYGIDKTGDALKEFTIRATDMSVASKAGYDLIGMSQEKMTKKLLAGGPTAAKAFEQIVGGLRGIKDPAKQSQAALALFGTPLEDLSVAEIPKFLAGLTQTEGGLGKVGGAADRMGDTLNDNRKTAFESFRRSAIGLVTDLMDMPGPLGFVASSIAAVGPAAMGVIAPMASMVAASRASAAASMVAGGTVKKSWLASSAAAGKSVARQVGAWALLGAKSLLHAAKVAAAWIIAMGPIAIVIAAVIGLVVLIVKNWDKIKKITTKVWGAITKWLANAWDKITDKFRKVWKSVTDWFKNLWGNISSWFRGKWNDIRSWFGGLISGIASRFRDSWGNIASFFRNLWNNVSSWFRSKWAGIRDWFSGLLRAVGDRFRSAWNNIVSFFQSIPGRIGGVINRIKGFFGSMWNGIASGARSALNGAIGLVNGLIGGVNTLIGGFNRIPMAPDIPSIPNIPYLAKGGDITQPGSAIVGERGPELLSLPRGARVTPLDGSQSVGGSSYGNIYVTIDARSIREMRDVSDFFAKVKQQSRKGAAAGGRA